MFQSEVIQNPYSLRVKYSKHQIVKAYKSIATGPYYSLRTQYRNRKNRGRADATTKEKAGGKSDIKVFELKHQQNSNVKAS